MLICNNYFLIAPLHGDPEARKSGPKVKPKSAMKFLDPLEIKKM